MGNVKEVKDRSKQSIEDRALVAIIQNDKSTSREKESAFNKLYSNHQRQVLVYFLKKVKDSEIAEDLKMVTFEKVHANIHKYDDKFAFSTWMYKIAYNSFVDNSRKSQFEVLSIDALSGKTSEDNDGMEFQIKSGNLNPEETLERNQRISAVRNAIDTVDNDFIRDLIKKRFIDELSFEQIAEEMGIANNSTLRVNILRGKEILKNKLVIANTF